MSSGIFGIATSGLLTYQRALGVTGHNIANAATEGYSRQRAELSTRPPQFVGNGYFGNGVQVSGVNRIVDQFVNTQLRLATSASAGSELFHNYARRIDSLLADTETGLSAGLQQFFGAVQDVANDPTSIPARQVLLAEADALVNRFGFLSRRLDEQRDLINGQIQTTVSEINSLAEALAKLNPEIAAARLRGGAAPNDLLDQRDGLIRALAERVSVTTLEQDDGALNVFIGNGQSLVVGNQASLLTAKSLSEDARQISIGFTTASGGAAADITRFISGGRLGALLDVRTSVLDIAENSLGRTAVGLAVAFNAQHGAGLDFDQQPGGAFFSIPEPQVLPGRAGLDAPTVEIDDIQQLGLGDFRLRFNGTEWEARDLTSGQSFGPFATDAIGEFGGIRVDFSTISSAEAGDTILVRPTRVAARDISVVITDPRAVAAASPDGDTGVGDNRNALLLAALQDVKVLAQGSATLGGSYNTLVADVGTKVRQAEVAARAQQRLLDEAWAQRESISGVNLDEEAANLLRFQQAYQASAQVIAVANTLFDTLLGAVRR